MGLTKLDIGLLKQHNSRNDIINGNFDVWQRGTTLTTSGAAEAYLADRFAVSQNVSYSVTEARSTSTPDVTSVYCLELTNQTAVSTLSSSNYLGVRYKIEGIDFRRFYDQEGVLSFWVYSSLPGTYCVAYRNASLDATYISEYTITTANTWQFINIPVNFTYGTVGTTWDYSTGVGLDIMWTLSLGSTHQGTAGSWLTGNYVGSGNQVNWAATSGNVFRLSRVQFELGTLASRFEYVSYSETISRARRYYENMYVNNNIYSGSSSLSSSQAWNIQKRANPTITFTGSQSNNTFGANQYSWWMSNTATTVTTYSAVGTISGNAEL